MGYSDFANATDLPYITKEEYEAVAAHIKAENRKHLNNLMIALNGKRKIDAIRELRNLADFGLKEAKDYVEALMDKGEPETLGSILNHATARDKLNYLVVREGEHSSYVRGTLVQCRENAEDVVRSYPHEHVYVCQILSESQEVTTYKMVDL